MAYFIFDKDQFVYRPEKRNIAYYLRVGLPYLGVGLVVAAVLLLVFYLVFDSQQAANLKAEQELLKTTYTQLEDAHQNLGNAVDSLKKRDRNLYLFILNAEPLEEKDSTSTLPATVQTATEELDQLEERLKRIRTRLNERSTSPLLEYLRHTKPEDLRNVPVIRPLPGDVLSGYGMRRHPLKGKEVMHTGIDLQADIGTPVVATANGVVIETGVKPNGQGQFVAIRHALGYVTRYAHLSQIGVFAGQVVTRGQVIGKSGNSGICKGAHLHYEVWKDNQPIDPIDHFFGDITPEMFSQLRAKAAQNNESMD
jgi:murein DD-endopeptidase MepM/ murein hydrolase activator NlpD